MVGKKERGAVGRIGGGAVGAVIPEGINEEAAVMRVGRKTTVKARLIAAAMSGVIVREMLGQAVGTTCAMDQAGAGTAAVAMTARAMTAATAGKDGTAAAAVIVAGGCEDGSGTTAMIAAGEEALPIAAVIARVSRGCQNAVEI